VRNCPNGSPPVLEGSLYLIFKEVATTRRSGKDWLRPQLCNGSAFYGPACSRPSHRTNRSPTDCLGLDGKLTASRGRLRVPMQRGETILIGGSGTAALWDQIPDPPARDACARESGGGAGRGRAARIGLAGGLSSPATP